MAQPAHRAQLKLAAAAALVTLVASPGAQAQARTTWSHETLGAVWAAPLVTPGGQILVGSEDGILYALDRQGRLRWSYKASDGWSGWPIWLRRAKLAVVGNRNGKLYYFDEAGELQRRVNLEGAVVGRPATYKERLFVGTAKGRLVAINNAGRILWYHSAASPITGFPAVSPDGKQVYAGTVMGSVVALDSEGKRLWETKVGLPVRGGMVASIGGVIVAASGTFKKDDGKRGVVVALDTTGKERWRRAVDAARGGLSPWSGGVLVGTDKGRLLALDSAGKRRWSFTADAAIQGLPLASGRWILFGTERGTLYALDLLGRPLGLASAAGAIRGGLTVAGQRVLFGSNDRRVYSLPLPTTRSTGRWQRSQALKTQLMRTPRAVQLWRRELSGAVAAGVTQGAKGTFVAATWGNKVFVLDSKGEIDWNYNCGAEILTLPAVSPRGDLLFGCGDGGFYGLKPDGNMRFRLPVNKGLASSPAVARDGTVYFGARDKRVYALDRTGKIRWKIRTGDDVDGAPCIASDGIVYIGSDDRHLYAINPNGDIVWYKRLPGAIRTRPALARSGGIYVTTLDQRLHALGKSGGQLWSYQTSGQITSSPAVSAKSGVVFFGSRDHKIYAVGPQGKLRWSFATAGEVDSSPALTDRGAVVAGSDDGVLYALDQATGKLRWWYSAGAEIRGELVAGAGGSVVFGTMDGSVVAVAPPKPGQSQPVPRKNTERFRIGRGRAGAAVAAGDAIVVAGEDGTVRAFGADRWPQWNVPAGVDQLSRPHRVSSELYAVTDARGDLSVLEPGRLRFKLRLAKAQPTVPSSIVAGGDPLILVGTRAGRLWAVTTAGKVRWFFSGSGPISRPALALDPTTILVPVERELVSLDRAGHRRWIRKFKAGILSGPAALEHQGLVGSGTGKLAAQVADRAEPTWEHDLGAGIKQIEPIKGASSTMVLLTDGRVLELSATGEHLLEVTPPTPPREIVHVGGGVVYLVGGDNAVLRLDRRTGKTRRVLDTGAPVVHVGPSGPSDVIIITSDGQATVMRTARKTE